MEGVRRPPKSERSGVSADEQNSRNRERSRRVTAEKQEAGPGREMIAAGDGHDRFTGSEGQVRRGRVVPARRQDVHQWRQHEHDRDEGRDPAGRVADDRAESRGRTDPTTVR